MFELSTLPNPAQYLHILGDIFLAVGLIVSFFLMIAFFIIPLFKPKLKTICYIGCTATVAAILALLILNYTWPLFFGFPK